MTPSLIRQHRHHPPLVQSIPFVYLTIIPVILAVATCILLFLASDVNAALLWSQCHARARIPVLSRIPLVGTVLCYLPSFFHEALASTRSAVVLAVVLAFVGALLTVSLVEAARPCNAPSSVIARPTGPWLVFNLIGGAAVWQLAIVPAFLYRAKQLYQTDDAEGHASKDESARHIPRAEVLAIPISVALGFYLPSILMITLNSPAIICVWLFFPVLVSVVRQATRWGSIKLQNSSSTIHLESNRPSLLLVYALPIVLSVIAHIVFIGNLTLMNDDRKEMTRSTVAFIEFDAQAIGCTVLYWLLVEVGWEAPLALITMSVIVGPGAATCLTWAFVREKLFETALHEASNANDEADEQSPLLR